AEWQQARGEPVTGGSIQRCPRARFGYLDRARRRRRRRYRHGAHARHAARYMARSRHATVRAEWVAEGMPLANSQTVAGHSTPRRMGAAIAHLGRIIGGTVV